MVDETGVKIHEQKRRERTSAAGLASEASSSSLHNADSSPSKLEKPNKKKTKLDSEKIEEKYAFEDPHGDEYEEEEFVCSEDEEHEESDEEVKDTGIRPWRPGIDPIGEDEELEYDPQVYDMYHRAMLEWSCLSFDILPDQLGNNRHNFPHTAYVVTGTQAPKQDGNCLFIMKWRNLTKDRHRNDDSDSYAESESDNESDDMDEPILEFRANQHCGTVNRVRCCPQLPRLTASWSSTGKVHMWDLQEHLKSLDEVGNVPTRKKDPKYTFSGHSEDGFAMAFNPHRTGFFASGSCDSTICIWNPVEAGWIVENPFKAHGASVEDIQWKQLGCGINDTFASCGADNSIRLFNLSTSSKKPQLVISRAHDSDVNVISWSPFQEDFLLSGSDDGSCRVWDMRNTSEPIVHLHYHQKPISSVSWHPTDPAVFSMSSLDNSITIWDMSVEPDDADLLNGQPITSECPDQLMFQHMGQSHISEIQWHPQIPGVMISTAEDGFNIFKTFNV